MVELAGQLIVLEEFLSRRSTPEQAGSTFSLSEIKHFDEPLQETWLDQDEEDNVFQVLIPDDSIAFITAIGLSPVRKGDYYFWKDGHKEQSACTHTYGTIDSPTQFEIGLLSANSEIKFTGHNDDDQKGYFRVLCRGFWVKRDLVDEFFATLGRSGVKVTA